MHVLYSPQGEIISNPSIIQQMLLDHFHDHWKVDEHIPQMKLPIAIPTLSPLQSSSLIQLVIEVEIESAIMNIDLDKASGPNGFSACFFQKFWTTIKADIVNAIFFLLLLFCLTLKPKLISL